MIERLAFAAAVILLGLLAYRLATRAVLIWRARKGLMLNEYSPGRPAVLYFTAPGCVPCETVQRPALAELRALYGRRLQIIQIDASERTDLADSWGVLAVPTTFIIDSESRPRGVNHGVARADRLRAQLEAIGELPRRIPAPRVDPGYTD